MKPDCRSLILPVAVALMTAAAACAGPRPVADRPLTAEEIQSFKGVVETTLQELNARQGQLAEVAEEPVRRLFPQYAVFAVRFREYPVNRTPPQPLSSRNLFILSRDRKIRHLKTTAELEAFFKTSLHVVREAGSAKDAARAWLRLSQEFSQDGFFKFAIPEERLSSATAGRKVTGAVTVVEGGKGEIVAVLTFSGAGRLQSVTQTAKVMPGVRPICQATKLLDPDPIVRGMAEKDILVMGQAAKEYLQEQRAAAAPELRKAIDRIWKRILDEGW